MNIHQTSPIAYGGEESLLLGRSVAQDGSEGDPNNIDGNSSLVFGNDLETQKDSLQHSRSLPLIEDASNANEKQINDRFLGDTQKSPDDNKVSIADSSTTSTIVVPETTIINESPLKLVIDFGSQILSQQSHSGTDVPTDTQPDTSTKVNYETIENTTSQPRRINSVENAECGLSTVSVSENAQHVDNKKQDSKILQDTQVIRNVGPQETQEIHDAPNFRDTQPLHLQDTQIIQDTQCLQETQSIQDTQIIQDTQVINNTEGPSNTNTSNEPLAYSCDETQKLATPNQHRIDANFQRFASVLEEDEDVELSTLINGGLSSPNIEIPDTTAKPMLSHTQVVNTQELPIHEVYLKSTYTPIENTTSEVEEVESEVDDHVSSQIAEDSLISAKLKRNTEHDLEGNSNKHHQSKSLLSTKVNSRVTPSKTPGSSGFSGRAELVNIHSDSSFTKESSDMFMVAEHGTSGRRNLPPPSSPEVVELDQQMHASNPAKDSANSNELFKPTSQMTTRRRKNFIVESQDENLGSNNSKQMLMRKEVLEILFESEILFRDSVWVSYNLKMYPGLLIEKGPEYLNIEFDEGTFSIKNSDIYLLDIRIGDSVCLKNSPAKYKVTGLSFAESQNPIKCIRGYNVVHLQRFNKVKEFSEISVPLCECYMDISDWVKHQQDFKLIFEEHDLLKDRFESVLRKGTLSTISERNSRGIPFNSPTRSKSLKRLPIDTSGKVFSQKLFCITSIEGDRKEQIIELIKTNGGTVINEDFYLLFSYGDNDEVQMNVDLTGLTFGAMISNSYCRSAKYLQALALGWPILSDSFIVDCTEGLTNFDEWPVYLLPAGQSTQLQSVKSLDVYKFRRNFENKVELKYQTDLNFNLLEKYDIIMLNSKKNSDTLETCKFVFYSFGVRSLKYRTSYSEVLNDIKKLSKSLANILVFDESGTVLSKLQVQQSSTRKTRSQVVTNKEKINAKIQGRMVGVINWEWVVQCVISSHIWSPQIIHIPT